MDTKKVLSELLGWMQTPCMMKSKFRMVPLSRRPLLVETVRCTSQQICRTSVGLGVIVFVTNQKQLLQFNKCITKLITQLCGWSWPPIYKPNI